jgi:hypothetical protein
MKKRAPFNQNAAIRGAIRRVFARSPVVREVLMEGRREVPKYNKDSSRSKKDAVQYSCQVCFEWVSSTKISVDHIDPVISIESGFVDWNEFVTRLWCSKENLQRICDDCHQKKTNNERFQRQLKKDIEEISALEKAITISSEKDVVKAKLKKFSKKKISKLPDDVKARITALKLKIAIKV